VRVRAIRIQGGPSGFPASAVLVRAGKLYTRDSAWRRPCTTLYNTYMYINGFGPASVRGAEAEAARTYRRTPTTLHNPITPPPLYDRGKLPRHVDATLRRNRSFLPRSRARVCGIYMLGIDTHTQCDSPSSRSHPLFPLINGLIQILILGIVEFCLRTVFEKT